MAKAIDIKTLFGRLQAEGVRYCHWKSNVRLAKSLAAETDLDLLVTAPDMSAFLRVVEAAGCREVRNPGADTFPHIRDYFLADGAGQRMFHLHVHERVIFGHKHLKEYEVPLEDECMRVRNHKTGVRVPPAECELLIHILRLAVKSFTPMQLTLPLRRVTNARPSVADMEELETLRAGTDRQAFSSLVARVPFKLDKEAVMRLAEGMADPIEQILWRIARSLGRYRRMFLLRMLWRLGMQRLRAIPARLNSVAAAEGLRKRLAVGFLATVVGSDGSGKTTVLGHVERLLGRYIAVSRFYLGSNRPGPASRIFRVLTLPAKALSLRLAKLWKAAEKMADVIVLVQEWFYLRERLHRLHEAQAQARMGELVLLERFPVPGVQDAGYNLTGRTYSGRLERLRQNILAEYDRFPGPGVAVYLAVDPAVAAQRKPDHDRAEIVRKAEAMDTRWAEIPAKRRVRVDAGQPLESVVAETVNAIWNTVS